MSAPWANDPEAWKIHGFHTPAPNAHGLSIDPFFGGGYSTPPYTPDMTNPRVNLWWFQWIIEYAPTGIIYADNSRNKPARQWREEWFAPRARWCSDR